MMPGIYIYGLTHLEKKVLNNFGKNRIVFYNSLIVAPTRLISCWWFVWREEMGISGLGMSNLTTQVISYFALIIAEINEPDMKEVIKLPTKQAFDLSGLWEYIKLGTYSTIIICLDWWVWEFMIFFSGLFSVADQASQTVLMHIVAFAYMAGMGLDQSSATIIGYNIGKKSLKKAKLFYK